MAATSCSSMSERALIEAIADTAADWRDPEYGRRMEAVTETLEADNAFTEEAVAFAVNQQMLLLTADALTRWIGGRHSALGRTIGVLNPGNIPFVGLQEFLAVLLTGHRYLGTLSSKSPSLLPCFARDLERRFPALHADFADVPEVLAAAEAVIATGSEETKTWVSERCDDVRIGPERRLLRGHSFAVAVLDGRETDDDYERLAEDTLLHEGFGCRSVALIWAPHGLAPDALLDAFALFRGVFPAHSRTPGRLALQQAFLSAVERPHAFGDGLEFLLSRGDPEEQPPGHVRWTEYDALGDVKTWLRDHRDHIQLVVARASVRDELDGIVPVEGFGEAQRPRLEWRPDGIDTVEFLTSLNRVGMR